MSHQRASTFSDYDPYYGGGGYYGHGGQINDLSMFVMDHHVRMYWIAFFVLVAYWGFLWFLRHVFGDGHQNARNAVPTEEEAPAPPQATNGGSTKQNRLTRASQVLGDLTLMLLSVLVLNTIGQGGTRIIMILTWVFFGFAVFWSIFEASKESHIARFIFGMLFYGIILAIGIISFQHGFHSYGY
ncbi:hypothetical protein BC941DRAFT_473902 [Chlamydoabsidia padenii]|nr:hypothetical protein BC941DRAFT_473902 [Chlamydoabsidia padenii]